MLSIDFKSWNSLRDFIEGKENVHIDFTTHIDFLVSRAKKILRAEFEAGEVVITKDNIHLYYEFMRDEDIKNLDNSNLRDIATGAPIITTILSGRFCNVRDSLQIHSSKMDEFKKCIYGLNDFILSQSVFGVKDTLKPIDEYIAEIKASKDYQEYMLKNTKITLDITNIKSGATYDFCTYIIYDAGIEVKRFEDVAYTQKAFINFHKKIFNEFGCYKVNKYLLSSMSDYDYTKEFLL